MLTCLFRGAGLRHARLHVNTRNRLDAWSPSVSLFLSVCLFLLLSSHQKGILMIFSNPNKFE